MSRTVRRSPPPATMPMASWAQTIGGFGGAGGDPSAILGYGRQCGPGGDGGIAGAYTNAGTEDHHQRRLSRPRSPSSRSAAAAVWAPTSPMCSPAAGGDGGNGGASDPPCDQFELDHRHHWRPCLRPPGPVDRWQRRAWRRSRGLGLELGGDGGDGGQGGTIEHPELWQHHDIGLRRSRHRGCSRSPAVAAPLAVPAA